MTWAVDQAFVVAEILQVPARAAMRDFPEFPCAGTLVILAPRHHAKEGELNGLSAEIRLRTRTLTLRYRYWQVNSRDEIGLLGDELDEAIIPLGSPVRFVKRKGS